MLYDWNDLMFFVFVKAGEDTRTVWRDKIAKSKLFNTTIFGFSDHLEVIILKQSES